MRLFLLILILNMLCINVAMSGECTTITRSNFTTNQILTSTRLNTELNNLIAPWGTATGAADGGCLTDGTLEDGALNSTDFAVPLNYIREGCALTRTDDGTLAVDDCALSVDGSWVNTATSQSVAFGCAGCSAETASQNYYVFAKSDSVGGDLNLLILDADETDNGYDSSDNRIIGKFYNDNESNIATGMVEQFKVTGYDKVQNTSASNVRIETCAIDNNGTATINNEAGLCSNWIDSVSRTAGGVVKITLKWGRFSTAPGCLANASLPSGAQSDRLCNIVAEPTTRAIYVGCATASTGASSDQDFRITCLGVR